MRILFFACLFFCQMTMLGFSQTPFWSDIQAFEKQDSVLYPPKNAILFVGSSSFTKWTDVQSYFPGYTIINRGFGGSTLPDVIRYADQIIFPYDPKQIVIYCGENDFASSDTVTAEIVFGRFQQLFKLIRSVLPKVSIQFISMKPSPSRKHLFPKMIAANNMIQTFLATQEQAGFINVYDKMLQPNGYPNGSLFVSDSLHMNAKGYAIWKEIIQPTLKK